MLIRRPTGTLMSPARLAGVLAVTSAAACTMSPQAAWAEEPAFITRGPYLQCATPTSVVMRWRTNVPTDSRVTYGVSLDDLTTAVDDGLLTTEHEVTLAGMFPDMAYYYAVGTSTDLLAGGDSEHVFFTPPATPAATPTATRVWVIGDSGTANEDAAAVRDAYMAFADGRYTDICLLLGGNALPSGTDDEFQAAMFDMYEDILRQTVVWPTLGNHDNRIGETPAESGVYYEVFTMPQNGEAGGLASGTEAYYSFDYGNIHFICMDSQDTDRSAGGAMMTWLENDLADTLADWIIAFWHHPPYSKGSHDSDDPADSDGRMTDMRQIALPILEAGGVDLVLSGHSHVYERSYLLDGHYGVSDTLEPASILDDGDGRPDGQGPYVKPSFGVAPNEGAVYVVAGSAGKATGGSLDHPAMFISLNELGSMVLDVDGDRLDAVFIKADGEAGDRFTIIKGAEPESADFLLGQEVDLDDHISTVPRSTG